MITRQMNGQDRSEVERGKGRMWGSWDPTVLNPKSKPLQFIAAILGLRISRGKS